MQIVGGGDWTIIVHRMVKEGLGWCVESKLTDQDHLTMIKQNKFDHIIHCIQQHPLTEYSNYFYELSLPISWYHKKYGTLKKIFGSLKRAADLFLIEFS